MNMAKHFASSSMRSWHTVKKTHQRIVLNIVGKGKKEACLKARIRITQDDLGVRLAASYGNHLRSDNRLKNRTPEALPDGLRGGGHSQMPQRVSQSVGWLLGVANKSQSPCGARA